MASKELEQDRLAPQFDATKAATSHAQVMKLSQGVGGVSDLGCHSWSLEQAADHIISILLLVQFASRIDESSVRCLDFSAFRRTSLLVRKTLVVEQQPS